MSSTEWTTMLMNCMHATMNSIWSECKKRVVTSLSKAKNIIEVKRTSPPPKWLSNLIKRGWFTQEKTGQAKGNGKFLSHFVNLKRFRIDKIFHQRFESFYFVHLALEVVEGREDDVVTAFHEANRRQQLEHQRLRSELFVDLKKLQIWLMTRVKSDLSTIFLTLSLQWPTKLSWLKSIKIAERR